jgi:hypothetical protein
MDRQLIRKPFPPSTQIPTRLARRVSDATAEHQPYTSPRTSHDFFSIPLYASAAPIQRRANATGLPDRLKAGVEHLGGVGLDDVRVHRGSPLPAHFDADAHTRGSEIHLAPGQENLLAHEAWHVVQQRRGRVRPTTRMGGHPINDDLGLEREADVMGQRALANTAGPYGEPLDHRERHKESSHSVAHDPDSAEVPASHGIAGAVPAASAIQLGKKKTDQKKPPPKKTKNPPKATKKKAAKKEKVPPTPELLELLEEHANSKAKNRHEKQDTALENLTEAPKEDREAFASYFQGKPEQVKANEEAITSNVRMGGLNELLRTADTPQAAIRSMDQTPGVHATQSLKGGGETNWLKYQRGTSGPTENFVFKGTTPEKEGPGVIQDSHTNALMKLDDKPTVGGTSWPYHNDPKKPSLASNFAKLTHVRSLANRNYKLHAQELVTDPEDMLQVPSSKRAAQTFKTKKGETLQLDNPDDLKKASRIAAVRGRKELTRQRGFIEKMDTADSESESEIEAADWSDVDIEGDSQEIAEQLFASESESEESESEEEELINPKAKKKQKKASDEED